MAYGDMDHFSPRARNRFNQVVEAKRFEGVFLCRKVRTKTILGNREHKKTNFRFWGNRGKKSIYFRGTREQVPPPPGRASYMGVAVILVM